MLIARIFGALPDAATSVVFLVAWIAPAKLGPQWVKDLMLTMLIEFIVMHSSAFYAAMMANSDVPRLKRAGLLTGLSAFYLIFVAAFALGFHSTWPFFAFGWLFASRFINLWTHPALSQQAMVSMGTAWVASLLFYIGGVFATIIIPLPALGLTRDFVASMHLSGSGLWIDHPHTVIAFGALYFGAQAWFKFYASSAAFAAKFNTVRVSSE